MSQLTTRRAFLGGRTIKDDRTSIRPPGAADEGFADLCSKCGDCGPACPESIISFGADGYPVVDLTAGSCTFCQDCVQACSTQALTEERVKHWPWRARVLSTCLSLNGVSCRACQDNCDHGAIRFKLKLGGRSEPVLDTDSCTGCGSCASACPVGAIEFTRQTQNDQEAVQ